jgi:hypothetical protein
MVNPECGSCPPAAGREIRVAVNPKIIAGVVRSCLGRGNLCGMEIDSTAQHPTVTNLFRQFVLPFYPQSLHESIERELPTLGLQAYQLGLEVLVSEQQGIKFSAAVTRADCLKMGRVYFGASNLLQWRLPPSVFGALKELLNHAINGALNPARSLLFAIAGRNDPEGALCRFLIWTAVRVNLLVLTWDKPGVEIRGSLDEADNEAEAVLRRMLDAGGFNELDARPLHELVAEMMVYLSILDRALVCALNEFGSEMRELLINTEGLEMVRRLDAPAAAVFRPGRSDGPLGSQQIADRYPQYFASANVVEQRRCRTLRQSLSIEQPGDRLIDLIRSSGAAP